MKDFETKNARLKLVDANLTLEIDAVKDVLQKKVWRPDDKREALDQLIQRNLYMLHDLFNGIDFSLFLSLSMSGINIVIMYHYMKISVFYHLPNILENTIYTY